MDNKLVELDVESSGEFGDVFDILRCCVGAPLEPTTSTDCMIAIGSGALLLETGAVCTDIVLADVLCPKLRRTEVALLRLARRRMGSCFGDESMRASWLMAFPGFAMFLLREEPNVACALA